MRPVGLGDELRAALVAGGHAGATCACTGRTTPRIHRRRGRPDHAPRPAHRARPAPGDPAAPRPAPGEAPGPVSCCSTSDLSLVASTPEAEHLLPLIGHGSTRLPLPVSVYSVAAALSHRGARPDAAGGLPSTRVRATTGGWLNVHASRLLGRPATEHRRRRRTGRTARRRSALLLSAYGLTTRERDVARLVLRGARPKRSPTRCTSPRTRCRTTSSPSSTRSACGAGANLLASCSDRPKRPDDMPVNDIDRIRHWCSRRKCKSRGKRRGI